MLVGARNARRALCIPRALSDFSSLASGNSPGIGRGRGYSTDDQSVSQAPGAAGTSDGQAPGANARRQQYKPSDKKHHGYYVSGQRGDVQKQQQNRGRDGAPPQRSQQARKRPPRGDNQQSYNDRGNRRQDERESYGGRGGRGSPSLRADIAALTEALKGNEVFVEIPKPEQTGAVEEVEFTELFSELDYAIKESNLPLLKYFVRDVDIQRLVSGKLSPDEQQEIMSKLQAAVFSSSTEVHNSMVNDLETLKKPNRHIEEVLSSPITAGDVAPDQMLDAFKGDLMKLFNLTETDYERYKQEAAEDISADNQVEGEGGVSSNAAAKSRFVDMLQGQGVGADSPHYTSILEKLRVLEGNPGWPDERKKVFAKRLAKHLA